jgi:glycosyltransferase involved in cell wall biosynthesis
MLAIVSTHPIQYQTPIWQALAADGRVPFEVWYMTDHGVQASLDPEFGKTFRWDIDTTSGYPHRLLQTAPGAAPADFRRCRLTEDLAERLRAAGATAVWIQGWQVAGYWQTVAAARRAGVPVWLRAESNDLAPTPAWKQAVKRVVLGWLFARVDRFFCIGSANRRLYRKFGVPEARLTMAPYAVDNARFAAQAATAQPERDAIRRRWGVPDDAFCVLFCGKLIGKKRPLDLVEAARRLRADGRVPNIHLLFVGAGELDAAARAACAVAYDADGEGRAAAPSDAPPASFAGFLNQTEISQAYVAADLLALPSDHGETWGLVVNEAMASGLPCVVSDACGSAEDLAGPEGTFPLGDVAALADRLAGMAERRQAPAAGRLPAFMDTVAAVVQAFGEVQGRAPAR